MTVESVAGAVADVADRSKLLKRIGAASLGLLGIAGIFPRNAMALCSYHGCDLCSCPGNCSDLTCSWCWQGNCYNGYWHYCCEGYRSSDCSLRCPSFCSFLSGSYTCGGCGPGLTCT
jgi:hypothetical protein